MFIRHVVEKLQDYWSGHSLQYLHRNRYQSRSVIMGSSGDKSRKSTESVLLIAPIDHDQITVYVSSVGHLSCTGEIARILI